MMNSVEERAIQLHGIKYFLMEYIRSDKEQNDLKGVHSRMVDNLSRDASLGHDIRQEGRCYVNEIGNPENLGRFTLKDINDAAYNKFTRDAYENSGITLDNLDHLPVILRIRIGIMAEGKMRSISNVIKELESWGIKINYTVTEKANLNNWSWALSKIAEGIILRQSGEPLDPIIHKGQIRSR